MTGEGIDEEEEESGSVETDSRADSYGNEMVAESMSSMNELDSPDAERREQKEQDVEKKSARKSKKINTATRVHQDPIGKRQKMEDAVRKILLFKDYRSSDHKGEMDEDVKRN